jgi:hypothetical protein
LALLFFSHHNQPHKPNFSSSLLLFFSSSSLLLFSVLLERKLRMDVLRKRLWSQVLKLEPTLVEWQTSLDSLLNLLFALVCLKLLNIICDTCDIELCEN